MQMLDIPRGSTQLNVNREVFQSLKGIFGETRKLRFLDAPCGEGQFLRFIVSQFPEAEGVGVEISPVAGHVTNQEIQFQYKDLSKPFQVQGEFDVATCISGVMEFENTSLFIETCKAHLKTGGRLVITNDSTLMVRDRISYFLFGKVVRFSLLPTPGSPTYKCISIQELHRLLESHGFEVEKIRYTSTRFEDLLVLPFAILLYPINSLFLMTQKSQIGIKRRFEMFPFRSLFSRHYYLIAKNKGFSPV